VYQICRNECTGRRHTHRPLYSNSRRHHSLCLIFHPHCFLRLVLLPCLCIHPLFLLMSVLEETWDSWLQGHWVESVEPVELTTACTAQAQSDPMGLYTPSPQEVVSHLFSPSLIILSECLFTRRVHRLWSWLVDQWACCHICWRLDRNPHRWSKSRVPPWHG